MPTLGAAPASTPPLDGAFVFMRLGADGKYQTWVSCPDLSHARTIAVVEGAETGWATWSPDGSRIAIDSTRDDPDPDADPYIDNVYTVAPDGSGVRKLTDSSGYTGSPAWSSDGTLIAMEVDQPTTGAAGIFVMDAADGSDLRRVTTAPAGYYDSAPRFAPSGERIVLTRKRLDRRPTGLAS